MALSNTGLQGRIVANLLSAGFVTGNSFCKQVDMATAIAWAVVDEITANLQIVAGTATDNNAAGGTYAPTQHIHTLNLVVGGKFQ